MNISEKNYVIDLINESLDLITDEHMMSYPKTYPTIRNNLDYLNKLKAFLDNDNLRSSETSSDELEITDKFREKSDDLSGMHYYYAEAKELLSDELNNFIDKYYEFLTQQINTQPTDEDRCCLSTAYEDYWLKIHLELHVVMPRLKSTLRTMKREVA